jgi:hypothetical protein
MKRNITAKFRIERWLERTWDGRTASDVDGVKQTSAQVGYTYNGEIEGHSEVQYLMTYNADGTGSYVGLEKVEGSMAGKQGSFVLMHTGAFDAEGVRGEVGIAPGSGTNELASLSGKGIINLTGQGPDFPIVLDVDLEA